MGGVLGGIGRGLLDILGGAHALKRQETEGFDWREKQAQEEFLRQQERERARQQNEAAESAQDDRLKGDLADILAGAQEGEEPDLESLLPQNIENLRRQRIIRGAIGAGKERKSALQAQRAASDLEREQIRQRGRLEALARTQEGQRALQDARLAANRDLTEDEQLHELGMLDRRLSAKGGARSAAGRPTKVPGADDQGRAGTWLISPEGGREFIPSAPTAGTRGKEESRGAAMDAFGQLMETYEAMGGQPEGGLSARLSGLRRRGEAAAGYNPEATTYRAGVRGFVPLMARALGHTGVLTEIDVERTEALFPQPGDTAEEAAQKRQILEDIMSGRRRAPFQAGGAARPSSRRTGHGPAVKRRTLPDGTVQYRDAQGNVWQE